MTHLKILGQTLGQQINYKIQSANYLTKKDITTVYQWFMTQGQVITFEQHRSLHDDKLLPTGRVIYKILDDKKVNLKEYYKLDKFELHILDNSKRKDIKLDLSKVPSRFEFFSKDFEMKDYVSNLCKFEAMKKE